MQPLLRHATRSIRNSACVIRPWTTIDISRASPIRTSTCLQCRFRSHRRSFADDTKPRPSPKFPGKPDSKTNGLSPSTSDSELPSAGEGRRSQTSKRLSHVMDHLQGNIFLASQRLNDLTGYSGIEALKASIATLEDELASCQEAVRTTRQNYKTTVADRAASQREVTTLLARKDTWTPIDLERFTSLYRSDHGNEQAVQEAATRLAETERMAEQAANKLSTSILSRYHEEQIWSDKIRRMSTWGTWGLMGVNVLIFLVFQFGFEPWRRKRLVKGFEEKVQEALKREKEKLALAHEDVVGVERAPREGRTDGLVTANVQQLESEEEAEAKRQKPAYIALATVISNDARDVGEKENMLRPPTPTGFDLLRQLDAWKSDVLDLFSDRKLLLSKQDVTIVALKGAVTGATILGLILFMMRPT